MSAARARSAARLDEAPFPSRYAWLKRIVVGCAVLFVALLGLRLWWGHVAYNRLEAEIAKYKVLVRLSNRRTVRL